VSLKKHGTNLRKDSLIPTFSVKKLTEMLEIQEKVGIWVKMSAPTLPQSISRTERNFSTDKQSFWHKLF